MSKQKVAESEVGQCERKGFAGGKLWLLVGWWSQSWWTRVRVRARGEVVGYPGMLIRVGRYVKEADIVRVRGLEVLNKRGRVEGVFGLKRKSCGVKASMDGGRVRTYCVRGGRVGSGCSRDPRAATNRRGESGGGVRVSGVGSL